MSAPSTWFDFSAECIYTAQKQKKNKSWRDGFCTCCFERGWIVLKLFPEGASTTSEPLELWRLSPNTPEAVAELEIELQVHLVQLLGNPQPLRGQWQPQGQQQPQPGAVQEKAISSQSTSSLSSSNSHCAASGAAGGRVLPKRRLAGGLLRPNGISPQGFRRPAPVPPDAAGFGVSGLDVSECKDRESAHPNSCPRTGTFVGFVPPLRRAIEEVPSTFEPLPLEKAWAVNGTKALLSSICLCCGRLEGCCCCCHDDPNFESSIAIADFFRPLFAGVQTEALLPCEQQNRQADVLPPVIGESCSPSAQDNSVDGINTPAEPENADDCSLATAAAQPQCDIQTLQATSKAPFQYEASLEIPLDPTKPAQGEKTCVHPPGFGAPSSATGCCAGTAAFSIGHNAAPPRITQPRSRFRALVGGCMNPASSGFQAAPYRSCQNSGSTSTSKASAPGPAAASCRTFNKPAATAGYTEAANRRNYTGQPTAKPQPPQPLQTEQRELWQQKTSFQQVASEAGVAPVGDLQRQAPPLLLAEGLPEGHRENLVDYVPITFCTAPTETPPFNAAYAAARHLFLPTTLEEKGLTASRLALRYFNSTLVSLQTALTETAQNVCWSNGCSPGVSEARFVVEAACIRLDGKHHYGFQQRVAEAHRQRKAQQQQMRRYQKLRQRRKRRIECGKIVSSASEADELEETSEDSECEATAPRQPGLLLDLSKANILPGPLLSVLEGNPAAKTSSIPFEKALSMKEQLGRNDIWAFSLDGRFEDWSKVLLVRSMWRGASPHTSCIKVSVLGPWPVALNTVRVPLIRFEGNGQLTQASLPAPPPLLLQIRQLLQGRCRSIGGVTAVWVGRLHDELASIEACHRLFKAEMALNALTVEVGLNVKCLDAASMELGKACAARVLGLGDHEGRDKAAFDADSTISQQIMMDVSSEDAEAVVCHCSNGEGSWMLNEEQQRVLIAISRWFRYSDERRPFELRGETQRHEEQHEEVERSETKTRPDRNCQDLQQDGVSIFSQDNQHPSLWSTTQADSSAIQARGEDCRSSISMCASVAAQGCITGPSAGALPGDEDIADLCLDAEYLDEIHRQKENGVAANVASASCCVPTTDSCTFLPSILSEDAKDGLNDQKHRMPESSISVPKSGRVPHEINTPGNTQNLTSGPSEVQKLRHIRSKQACATGAFQPSAVSVAFSSSLNSTAASMPTSSPPVFLVQGVFGAGKTTLLAATLATLCRLLDLAKSRSHVLLVCATNAAVDGVLLRLLRQYDCNDFARIGRLSEMQPELLPHAISSSAARNSAVHEFRTVLTRLLAAPGARPALASMAKELLRGIDSGAFPPSMQQWKRRRIWATTCSSFVSSDMFSAASDGIAAGTVFPFLLMDEASQVAEPLAAAVLTRANPLRCIFLGDTRQLPPTTRLRGPVAGTASSLFSRLLHRAAPPPAVSEGQRASAHAVEMGANPSCQSSRLPRSNALFSVFQMRLQYRCHPDLGSLAAELFYGRFVAHGVTAASRQSLLPEWKGALCLAVVRGSRETKAGRSLVNVHEAVVVARLVQHALHGSHATSVQSSGQAGGGFQAVRPRAEDLGVICFYRAQAEEVKRQLLRLLPKAVVDSVQVSTVDAFQGSEKEVIFLSLVRSNAHLYGSAAGQQQLIRGGTHDFLTCPHRVCVALTRARRQLVIVAADTFLKHQGGLWSHVCRRATQIHI